MRLAVRYQGRVQGVGFRATTRELAARSPVTGWVRNEPDGSVMLEVQGTAEQVEAVLSALEQTMGRVIRTIDRTPIAECPEETAFVIRR